MVSSTEPHAARRDGDSTRQAKKSKPPRKRARLTPAGMRAFIGRYCVPQSELARRTGKSQQYISKVLLSDRIGAPISGKRLEEIARAANDYLWDWEVANQLPYPRKPKEKAQ